MAWASKLRFLLFLFSPVSSRQWEIIVDESSRRWDLPLGWTATPCASKLIRRARQWHTNRRSDNQTPNGGTTIMTETVRWMSGEESSTRYLSRLLFFAIQSSTRMWLANHRDVPSHGLASCGKLMNGNWIFDPYCAQMGRTTGATLFSSGLVEVNRESPSTPTTPHGDFRFAKFNWISRPGVEQLTSQWTRQRSGLAAVAGKLGRGFSRVGRAAVGAPASSVSRRLGVLGRLPLRVPVESSVSKEKESWLFKISFVS